MNSVRFQLLAIDIDVNKRPRTVGGKGDRVHKGFTFTTAIVVLRRNLGVGHFFGDYLCYTPREFNNVLNQLQPVNRVLSNILMSSCLLDRDDTLPLPDRNLTTRS